MKTSTFKTEIGIREKRVTLRTWILKPNYDEAAANHSMTADEASELAADLLSMAQLVRGDLVLKFSLKHEGRDSTDEFTRDGSGRFARRVPA